MKRNDTKPISRFTRALRRRLFGAEKSRGFTLLLAALISSIALSVGIAIYTIAQKEITLSSLGKYSAYAFYNADSGAECALYWDIKGSSVTTFFSTTTPPSTITCDKQSVAVTTQNTMNGSTWQSTQFSFQYGPNSECANVYVTKYADAVHPAVIHTTIHADGLNVACGSIATDPTALERSIDLKY